MRITEKQLQLLLQIAMDSLRVNIVGNPYFLLDVDSRSGLVNEILGQQGTEIKEIDDVGTPPETKEIFDYTRRRRAARELRQSGNPGRECTPPETKEIFDFTAKGVSLLRRWRMGCSNSSTAQFSLTMDTISFLERYDKSVFLKGGL